MAGKENSSAQLYADNFKRKCIGRLSMRKRHIKLLEEHEAVDDIALTSIKHGESYSVTEQHHEHVEVEDEEDKLSLNFEGCEEKLISNSTTSLPSKFVANPSNRKRKLWNKSSSSKLTSSSSTKVTQLTGTFPTRMKVTATAKLSKLSEWKTDYKVLDAAATVKKNFEDGMSRIQVQADNIEYEQIEETPRTQKLPTKENVQATDGSRHPFRQMWNVMKRKVQLRRRHELLPERSPTRRYLDGSLLSNTGLDGELPVFKIDTPLKPSRAAAASTPLR